MISKLPRQNLLPQEKAINSLDQLHQRVADEALMADFVRAARHLLANLEARND